MTSKQTIHFVGIAGIGMSAIAQVLLDLGYDVQGSDLRENEETQKLKAKGAKIYTGHDASHIQGANILVYSSAIAPGNSELVQARKNKTLVLSRTDMMAELMRKKRTIVVGGSHGKTTTTSMIAHMMLENKLDPTFVVGGRLKSKASNAYVGKSDWFVAESDESDGSFLKLFPEIAVVTNIDEEHLDHYGDFQNLKQAFVDFTSRVPFDGLSVLCIDDPEVYQLLEQVNKPVITVGTHIKSMIRADGIVMHDQSMVFDVWNAKDKLAKIKLPLLGKHNVLNALCAFGVGLRLGLAPKQISKALLSFGGIDRRMDFYGLCKGAQVFDDYAHHPTEILATLIALKKKSDNKRVHVLYQPHRYTRLKETWQKHIAAFDYADAVYICPIYEASEAPIEGITAERLVKALQDRGKTHARYVPSLEAGVSTITKAIGKGDVICTMGAGTITQAANMFIK